MPPIQYNLQINGGPVAVVDFWSQANPTRVLVVSSHGMQDPPTRRLAGLDLAGPLPRRNYAFTTPFETALDNTQLAVNSRLFVPYVLALARHRTRFAALAPPSLLIYPYLNAIAGLTNALQAIATSNHADVLYLTDLQPYPQAGYIYLQSLLGSPHPLGGGTLDQAYDSFLLLTCRSSTALHQVGMGGAPAAAPGGLYAQETGGPVITPGSGFSLEAP